MEPSGGGPRGTLCSDAGTYVVKPRSGVLLFGSGKGFLFYLRVSCFQADEVERSETELRREDDNVPKMRPSINIKYLNYSRRTCFLTSDVLNVFNVVFLRKFNLTRRR